MRHAFLLYLAYVLPLYCIHGQSITDAATVQQMLRLEVLQQSTSRPLALHTYPQYPDQLDPGDWEIRLGLKLEIQQERLTGRVEYISYTAFPEGRTQTVGTRPEVTRLRQLPILVDTRFQDEYFDPLRFYLNQWINLPFDVACPSGSEQGVQQVFESRLQKNMLQARLDESQQAQLEQGQLPDLLQDNRLQELLCHLLSQYFPEQGAYQTLSTREVNGRWLASYFRILQPAQNTTIAGRINDRVTEKVTVAFFREGNWLDYWTDTLLTLDQEGNFAFSFPLERAQTISLYHGYKTMNFYMHPGDDLYFHTSANAFYQQMEFGGTAAADQEFLRDFYHQMHADAIYRSYDFQLLQRDQATYVQEQLDKEYAELEFLRRRRPGLSRDFASYMDRTIRFYYADNIWEAANRFYEANAGHVAPELVREAEMRKALFYRLPDSRTFDFSVRNYVDFQLRRQEGLGIDLEHSLLNHARFSRLLLPPESWVRQYPTFFLQHYHEQYELSNNQLQLLNELLVICKDPDIRRELLEFRQSGKARPPMRDHFIRNLPEGHLAPDWNFQDAEGVAVQLRELRGQKLLLHIGWPENLAAACSDVAYFRENQEDLPRVVHLIIADQAAAVADDICHREDLLVHVPVAQAQMLRDSYRLDNTSNHYYLLDEDGRVMANNYELATPTKMRASWAKLQPAESAPRWTAEQRLLFWRITGATAAFLLLMSLLYLWRRQLLERQEWRKRQLLEFELRGIRAQMNPHFLFNAMSSIQNLIRKNQQEKADSYLSQFAGLMRRTLRNTAEEFIPLSEELQTIEQYCALEALRSPFNYTIYIDPQIDHYNTYVPSMLLQPLVENAIIHGLLPQKGERNLQVALYPHALGLECHIIDTGIGIEQTQRQQHYRSAERKGFGVQLVRQRLALLAGNAGVHFRIEDRAHLYPDQQGTEVTLIIPVES